jgi:hypothetical protein
MLGANDVPQEYHLESEIQRLSDARRRHSGIIRDQKDQELYELHQEMWLSFEEAQVPDMIFPTVGEFTNPVEAWSLKSNRNSWTCRR